MQLLNPFLVLLALGASASPFPHEVADLSSTGLVETRDQPASDWSLLDLTIFNAKAGTPGASYITFTFQDNRKKFPLKTLCQRSVLPGQKPLNDNRSSACRNNTVAWSYDGKQFHVQRSYVDNSVGPPPQNVVTAFGHARVTNGTTRNGECGKVTRAKVVPVPISSMIAKRDAAALEAAEVTVEKEDEAF